MTEDELKALEQLVAGATPGPWKYDFGNWEVEGPGPDRYAICSMTPDDRKPPFHGQEPNPVDSMGDGLFIEAARTAIPKLIAEIRRLRA